MPQPTGKLIATLSTEGNIQDQGTTFRVYRTLQVYQMDGLLKLHSTRRIVGAEPQESILPFGNFPALYDHVRGTYGGCIADDLITAFASFVKATNP